ncbi:unnamed protein product [Lathyrus oleraceus]
MASTQSAFTETITGPKVRVVAKVRGFSDPDTNFETSKTVDWVSVNTENSGEVTISFKEQSSSRYSVDYCYNEHEDNEVIYSKEVKHLVSAAFEGINSTVIAHGARGSGKTRLIQGSLEKFGLAMLAISEFLSVAEKNGKSIAVSFYEVDNQDHAADLLNPEQSPILVLEDHGRIQFKGLTHTTVKSIAEFQNLYITACSAHTAAPKKGFERARRSHLGLIVHVFAQNESINSLVSKMNFVDMAGYEDARRKNGDASGVAENNKVNKSIYALLNVCHALSANESRVPFRESKLTRMLQDSLRGTSKVLLVSCLNPSFCQDTVYMLSLASRSCQRSHRTPFGSTTKTASSTRQTFVTIRKNKIPKSVSASTKELPCSISHIYDEETCVVAKKSEVQGRKLFDEVSHSAAKAEKVDSSLNARSEVELDPIVEKVTSFEDKEDMHAPYIINYSKDLSIANEGLNMNKENNNLMENEDCSPPISSQLRELQSLVSSTPLCMQLPEEKFIALDDDQISTETAEPRTPDTENLDVLNTKSFWETFNMHRSGMNSTEGTKQRTLDIEIRDVMNAKSHWETLNMHGFGIGTKSSTEVTEPRTLDIVMNAKSSWETCNLHGSGAKNSTEVTEPRTPDIDIRDVMSTKSPWETFNLHGSGVKNSLVKDYLRILNTAEKDELKKLKGIGEKRANYILELRKESPEPFKSLGDLKDIGLSEKQIKGMMKKEVGELFN